MDPRLHPRRLNWVKDDPSDPGRRRLDHPDVQRLIAALAPGSHPRDLGGVTSLNVWLDSPGWVLRVHQPYVTRPRLSAVQEVRRRLAHQGLRVPVALPWREATVFRCGNRWAEVEEYLPHVKPKPTPDAHVWLFSAMGTLHRALAALDVSVPRPVDATYAPPDTWRRWFAVTAFAVQDDPEAADIVRWLRDLTRRLHHAWIPVAELPQQLIHGDVRLGNLCRGTDDTTVYFDFGFCARRPRIYDLAYSLAFMVWAFDALPAPERFPWESVPRLIDAYEEARHSRLDPRERQALVPCTAAVPLFAAALDGFSEDPVGNLRTRLPFLRLSEWLLAHPDALRA